MKLKLMGGLVAATLLASSTARADNPAVHGMLLFGDQATYASHLPMFHSPHDYQLILKLALSDQPGFVTLSHYADAKSEGATLLTLVPEVMDLTKLLDGTKTEFAAVVFDGHFERGGKKLGPVIVNVDVVIFATKLDGGQPTGALTSYLLFGAEGEYYAAHMIKSKPNFDAILSINKPVTLVKLDCGRGACPGPISRPVPDELLPTTVSAWLVLPEVDAVLGGLFGIHSKVKKVIYLEENELAH